jgi:hypothetical protein
MHLHQVIYMHLNEAARILVPAESPGSTISGPYVWVMTVCCAVPAMLSGGRRGNDGGIVPFALPTLRYACCILQSAAA